MPSLARSRYDLRLTRAAMTRAAPAPAVALPPAMPPLSLTLISITSPPFRLFHFAIFTRLRRHIFASFAACRSPISYYASSLSPLSPRRAIFFAFAAIFGISLSPFRHYFRFHAFRRRYFRHAGFASHFSPRCQIIAFIRFHFHFRFHSSLIDDIFAYCHFRLPPRR